MKIVLSRKGFDSATGGVASPIFPDGSLYSLPIPGAGPCRSYGEIAKGCRDSGTDPGRVVADLTQGRLLASTPAHLDPDLDAGALQRQPGWRPAFGQTGAAQSHLDRCGIGPGDLFVFFGWFRPVRPGSDGHWRPAPGTRDLHLVFGWLQVGEVVRVDAIGRAALLEASPWLSDHPHLHFGPDPRNVIYLAADRLVLPGREETGLSGGGELRRYDRRLVLSDPQARGRSTWRVPPWFAPEDGRPPLTYHADPKRWRRDGSALQLRLVSQGQEFVLDCAERPDATAWVEELLTGDPFVAGSPRSL